MYGKKILLMILFGWMCTTCLADAPVVDYSQDLQQAIAPPPQQPASIKPTLAQATGDEGISVASMSLEQRTGRLEEQVKNINQQALRSKLEDLQQRVQQLSGKVDEQQHQIELLKQQQQNYYKDLDQRVSKNKPGASEVAADAGGVGAVPAFGLGKDPLNKASAIQQAQTAPSPQKTLGVLERAPKKSLLTTDTAALKEQQLYQTAIDLLPDKKDQSAEKLRAYLDSYPNGAYAGNSHYWLGEIAFLQSDLDQAYNEFNTVITKYPTSKKVADSLLKVAIIHAKQGNVDQAKTELQRLIKRYPSTGTAQRAKEELKTLGKK